MVGGSTATNHFCHNHQPKMSIIPENRSIPPFRYEKSTSVGAGCHNCGARCTTVGNPLPQEPVPGRNNLNVLAFIIDLFICIPSHKCQVIALQLV